MGAVTTPTDAAGVGQSTASLVDVWPVTGTVGAGAGFDARAALVGYANTLPHALVRHRRFKFIGRNWRSTDRRFERQWQHAAGTVDTTALYPRADSWYGCDGRCFAGVTGIGLSALAWLPGVIGFEPGATGNSSRFANWRE